MRYHKAGLAALATQPSHQFYREGVLVLKERHDSFFRRSEVSSERWCRLRGNLLCYFKSRDHWSEPAGVLVLENCSISMEETAPHTFTIEFGTGCQQVCEAASEGDRDGWVAAIRASALTHLADRVEVLQQQVSLKRAALQSPVAANAAGSSSGGVGQSVLLELSLCCDNLRCDGPGGLPPSSCVSVQLMPQHQHCWTTAHTTEVIQGSSNPVFVSSVVVGGEECPWVEDSCRVRLVVRRVLDPLSHTTTIIGLAVTSIGSIRSSVRQRLALVSLTGDAVGFVSVTSWAADTDAPAPPTAGLSSRAGEHGPPQHYTPTHTQSNGGGSSSSHHRRTQSLPPRLLCSKSKLPTPPQLCPTHTCPVTATYRFHSGLGGDIAVVEMMAESRLTFTLPQQLLSIWLGAERAWQEEVEALGLLSEPWHSRQRALVAMHSSRSELYQSASAALAACSNKGRTLKRSADKENPLLEFAPINLHLQRVWAQNESLRRTGFYDVHTVGAFAANALGCSHGGLLTLLQEQSRRCREDASSRADCSKAAVESTRRLRSSLASSLNALLAAIRGPTMGGGAVHQIIEDIKSKIDLLLSVLEPDMVEAAFDFLDQIKVPQSPSHLLTLASRNYSVHSNLAGYLSPETSLDRTIGLHVAGGSEANPFSSRTDHHTGERRQNDAAGLNKVPDVRLRHSSDRLMSPADEVAKTAFDVTNIEAKYYCSTDEPEPWDLIRLNLQASFICLSAKVFAIQESINNKSCTSPRRKLAPLAHIDGLSEMSAVSCDLLTQATSTPDMSCDVLTQDTNTPDMSSELPLHDTPDLLTQENSSSTPDVSPTEDDSGIGGMERVTPESERRQLSSASSNTCSARAAPATHLREDSNASPVRDACKPDGCNKAAAVDRSESCEASVRPKLASIMETSREDTIDSDDMMSELAATSSESSNQFTRVKRSDRVSGDHSPTISSTNNLSDINDKIRSVGDEASCTSTSDDKPPSLPSCDGSTKDCSSSKGINTATFTTPSSISTNSSTAPDSVSKEPASCVILRKSPSRNVKESFPDTKPTTLSPSTASNSYLSGNCSAAVGVGTACAATDTGSNTCPLTANKEGTVAVPGAPPSTAVMLLGDNSCPSSGKAENGPPATSASCPPASDCSLSSVVPSIIKLRGAVDGAVRTARLVHSLHRLQLPTDAIHQTHGLQYRRDVCFSQALTAAVSALMSRLWSRAADQTFLAVVQHQGPLLQFEGLLSCYGGDGARLSDMVVAIEDLATVLFVLVADRGASGGGHVPQPAVAGNRCSLRVVLPVPEPVLCLMTRDSASEPVTFHVTPVFFNVGINEEATLAGKLGLEGPQHRNNLDSFHRLAEYHHRYAKLNLPVENTKRVWSSSSSVGLTEVMARLRVAVHANKSKNTQLLTHAASATRAMAGLRFTSCKSGKDRTGMSVTLEQTNLLAAEFDLARTELQRSLQAMRSEGTRLINCQKNINVKKFAFNSIQLSMFPKDYVPPPGTYGATKT